MAPELTLTPTDFVALINQTLEFALPHVYIEGELADFRVSRNKWVYFDLKDEYSKVKCFASIFALPGPLQDGMMIRAGGQPRLHPQFGFSHNVQTIAPVGEGSIKKAFDLLKIKLEQEGLFADNRKRPLPYPPQNIALITSQESASYADFIKILNKRWPFINIDIYDVQVQGENASGQIIEAIDTINKLSELPEILVIIRGGGSLDDLAVFNDERLVRSIASSRVPTLVAIGHEIDKPLSELAADKQASTPSNAAEILVPDRQNEIEFVNNTRVYIKQLNQAFFARETEYLKNQASTLTAGLKINFNYHQNKLDNYRKVIGAYNPENILKRGYALVEQSGKIISSIVQIDQTKFADIRMSQGLFEAEIKNVTINYRRKS